MSTQTRWIWPSLPILGSVFSVSCGTPAAPVTPGVTPEATPLRSPDAGLSLSGSAVPTPKAPVPAGPPFARDAEGFRAAIRSRTAGVAACYTEYSAGRPNVEGSVSMHLVVDPKGAVAVAESGKPVLETTAPAAANAAPSRPPIEDAVLSACIAKELKSLQFVADSKGKETRVDYPLQLGPKRIAEGRI